MKHITIRNNKTGKTTGRMSAVILAAAVLFLLTACGGNDSKEEAHENAPTQPAAEAPAAEEVPAAQPPQPQEPQGDDGSQGNASSSGDIGAEQVQAIVLAKVPGATAADIHGLEWEYDDGRLEYEGTLYYNGYEYEFEIDGATGNILKWEIDD